MLMQELIETLLARMQESDMLMFDEDFANGPAPPPMGADTLKKFEAKLGYALPADLSEFYTLHDGWPKFTGSASILSLEAHQDDEVVKAIKARSALFDEFGSENPFKEGGLPVLFGEGTDDMLFYFSDGRDKGTFVFFDNVDREETFQTFSDFLRMRISVLDELIREENDGLFLDEG